MGLRPDTDFMLWMISDSVEKMQILTSKVYSTLLGNISSLHTYTFLVFDSQYTQLTKLCLGFMTDEKPMKYVIVYPFIKAREWYLLPFEERKKMMKKSIYRSEENFRRLD